MQITDNGWVFGLGVRFENDVGEKTNIIFYILVKTDAKSFDIESSLFKGKERVNTDPPQYARDLTALAERLYHGLDENLDALSGASGAAVGFKFQTT